MMEIGNCALILIIDRKTVGNLRAPQSGRDLFQVSQNICRGFRKCFNQGIAQISAILFKRNVRTFIDADRIPIHFDLQPGVAKNLPHTLL